MSLKKPVGSNGKLTDRDYDKCPNLTNFLSLIILSLTNAVQISHQLTFWFHLHRPRILKTMKELVQRCIFSHTLSFHLINYASSTAW